MSDIEKYSDATFESIKHTNADGQEYWLARELQAVLEYTQWRRFSEVIERAKESCKNSGYSVEDHFANVGKMVAIGSGAERKVDDLMLSRYACYLIVQNGDPRKEVIAVGQTYFAVKTRQQELIENYDILSEEQKRLAIRAEMVEHNKSLAEAAKQAGGRNAAGVRRVPKQRVSGLIWRPGNARHSRPQGAETERENS